MQMANRKEYVYQIRGSQLALVEKDFTTTDGLNYTYSGISGDGITDDIPSGSTILKSPLSNVTDGIEIEYAYSRNYRINDSSVGVTCESYNESTSNNGLLEIFDSASGLPTSGVDYIVITGSNRWDGLHKVHTLATGSMILHTKYAGASVGDNDGTFFVHTDVSVMEDESFEIDLPPYLSKALVYYVKAKTAEDRMDINAKEYMMKEFRKMLEKHESSKVSGPRMMMPGNNSIR
jgi:hypothetical protein